MRCKSLSGAVWRWDGWLATVFIELQTQNDPFHMRLLPNWLVSSWLLWYTLMLNWGLRWQIALPIKHMTCANSAWRLGTEQPRSERSHSRSILLMPRAQAKGLPVARIFQRSLSVASRKPEVRHLLQPWCAGQWRAASAGGKGLFSQTLNCGCSQSKVSGRKGATWWSKKAFFRLPDWENVGSPSPQTQDSAKGLWYLL